MKNTNLAILIKLLEFFSIVKLKYFQDRYGNPIYMEL